jgi:predicted ATPase
MADPGVGKSRLFYEFKATSQSDWTVLDAFSVSYGKASAYLPVLGLLSAYFEISRDDDERKQRERILGKVLGLDRSLEDTLPYLYALYGIAETGDSLARMDPRIRRRRTQDAVKRIVLRESINQPLMVIFEDLHWIDSETQALLKSARRCNCECAHPAAGELSAGVPARVGQPHSLYPAGTRATG